MDTISFAHGTAVAASSSSLCHSNCWKYEVFLSFRGDDTCTTFTDHLSIALHNAGIHTLIDYQLRRGENIQSELDQEIKRSRNTVLCLLKEVRGVWMVPEGAGQDDQEGKVVYPILYNVDPSQVRK